MRSKKKQAYIFENISFYFGEIQSSMFENRIFYFGEWVCQNIKNICKFTVVATSRVRDFGKSGLNRVAMARHGLRLWENDATGLNIILK